MRTLFLRTLAAAASLILVSPSIAQYRQAAEQMYAIGSTYAREIRDLSGRKPVDEAKLYGNTVKLKEASKKAAEAIAGFGDTLAEAARSPHESMLRQPQQKVKDMIYQLGRELPERCDKLLKLINTDVNSRGSGWASELETEAIGITVMAEARHKDWMQFAEMCDKLRRWLADSLKSATNDRDRAMQDSRPIQDAQNEAWKRLNEAKRNLDRANSDHDRALERVVAAEIKENESYDRWREAVARGLKSEDTWVFRQRWSQAASDELDALTQALGQFQTLNSAREEMSRAYVQLAQTQKQMREFTAAGNADKAVEQFNNFTRWTELFERDLNR